MARTPKDTRTRAEKARDTRNIIASWMHEGYVPTPEAEAVHAQVARGGNHERGGDRDLSGARARTRPEALAGQIEVNLHRTRREIAPIS